MIVFEDVAKRYAGGYTALAGVSFEIRHGELVVLSGHSGAGKSTLFKLIPVIERPTAGRVLINGQDVSHLPKTAIPYLRRNLGRGTAVRLGLGPLPTHGIHGGSRGRVLLLENVRSLGA